MDAFAAILDQALAAGDVAALQIRLKPADDAAIRAAVQALAPIARRHDVAVILNDRPDLARATGCDGVHIGQEDGSLAEARRVMGPDAMIGVTCHDDRDLAWDAAEGGADYVAFGAFYPTDTKQTVHRPSLDLLTVWQETVETPCVAIGGSPSRRRPTWRARVRISSPSAAASGLIPTVQPKRSRPSIKS